MCNNLHAACNAGRCLPIHSNDMCFRISVGAWGDGQFNSVLPGNYQSRCPRRFQLGEASSKSTRIPHTTRFSASKTALRKKTVNAHL